MSSNVSQSYPYTSETEEERAAAIAHAAQAFEGVGDKIAAETTPLGPDPDDDAVPGRRWWVWVCPKDDYVGRLHVAGYALERHGLYTVCDHCGATFLR